MQTINGFRIGVYTKRKLACLYNPDITPRCAIRVLVRWIKYNEELYSQLLATGYHSRTRTFTPRQVHIIVSILDTP